MKTRRHIFGGLTLAAAALVCLTGCKKDDEGEKVVLGADFEQTAGTQKTYVGNSDKTIYWNTGDKVWVNDDEYTVNEGAVEVKLANSYYAVYPAEDNTVGESGGTVVIPATQTYTEKDGHQVLGGPMAARLDSKTGRLLFRNLYAVIKVTVKAGNAPFILSSITVESTKDLAGTETFSFLQSVKTGKTDSVSITTVESGLKSVTLTGINSTIPANGSASFYLYTVPFSGADLTVKLNDNLTDNGSHPRTATVGRSQLGKTSINVAGTTAEYVDLGLSVLWATCNVGASKPEAFGDYFAWGETEPNYESLVWTSATCTPTWKSGKNNGYCWQSYCGQDNFKEWTPIPYDNSTKLLKPDYDAATANWGGNWRTPTQAELDELLNAANCTWTWETNYNGSGYSGHLITSKKTGYTDKAIFLPAAGYFNGKNLENGNSTGFYWSSILYNGAGGDNHAMRLYFGSTDKSTHQAMRQHGFPVRPVMPKN